MIYVKAARVQMLDSLTDTPPIEPVGDDSHTRPELAC